MSSAVHQSLLVGAAVTGLVSLDRTAIGQFQLARPLVAASLLGYALGRPSAGVVVGVLYELLFLHSLPVGSQIPYSPLVAAMLGVVLAVAGGSILEPGVVLPAAICFSLPAVMADRLAMITWRRTNWRIMSRAEAYMRLGRYRRVRIYHLLATVSEALYSGAAFLAAAVILLPLYLTVLRQMPHYVPLLSVAGVLPFYFGLAGLTQKKVSGRGWFGLAAGAGTALFLGKVGLF